MERPIVTQISKLLACVGLAVVATASSRGDVVPRASAEFLNTQRIARFSNPSSKVVVEGTELLRQIAVASPEDAFKAIDPNGAFGNLRFAGEGTIEYAQIADSDILSFVSPDLRTSITIPNHLRDGRIHTATRAYLQAVQVPVVPVRKSSGLGNWQIINLTQIQ